jgi:hypothetical protein
VVGFIGRNGAREEHATQNPLPHYPSHLAELEIMNYAASPQFEVAKVGKLLQSEKRADTNPSHQSSLLLRV